jgi:hypothetical protein
MKMIATKLMTCSSQSMATCVLQARSLTVIIEYTPELTAVLERAKLMKPHFRQPLIATRAGKAFTGTRANIHFLRKPNNCFVRVDLRSRDEVSKLGRWN